MATLQSRNVSAGDNAVACNAKPSNRFDDLISQIGKLLDQSTNVSTEITPLVSELIHDTRSRVKIDLDNTRAMMLFFASASNSVKKNSEMVKKYNKTIRRKIVTSGEYQQLSIRYKAKLSALPLYMDSGSYAVAGNFLVNLAEYFSKFTEIMHWFDYVTNIIAHRNTVIVKSFDESMTKQASVIRKLTKELGAVSSLMEFTSGKFNHEGAIAAIEHVEGIEIFNLVVPKRFTEVAHSAEVVKREFRWGYTLERSLPNETIENLIDVADSILKFREVLVPMTKSLYQTTTAIETASEYQVYLWQSQQ